VGSAAELCLGAQLAPQSKSCALLFLQQKSPAEPDVIKEPLPIFPQAKFSFSAFFLGSDGSSGFDFASADQPARSNFKTSRDVARRVHVGDVTNPSEGVSLQPEKAGSFAELRAEFFQHFRSRFVFQLRKQPQLVRQGEARQVDRHGRGAVYLPAAKSTAFFYRVLFFVNRSGRSVFRRRRRLLKKKLFRSASSTIHNFLSESESVLGAGKCFQA
jgi:hypothetical protein